MSEVQWPHEDNAALNAFYGNPRGNHADEASAGWEAANLIRWVPVFPMFYSDGEHTPLKTMRIHKKCFNAFEAAFKDVLATLGHDYIVAHRLNISGGTYCFRLQRGGSRLSVHAWGCAIDMDPGHNPFPHKWTGGAMIDAKFADILTRHGFCWRGAHGDDDPMHFQLCRH
jgi:hypothetical protein